MQLLTPSEIHDVSGARFNRVAFKLIDWAISGAAWEGMSWVFSQERRTSSGGQMNSARRSTMYG